MPSAKSLVGGVVVVVHGALGHGIVRFRLQHRLIDIVSLTGALVLHQPITEHELEIGIIGMAVSKTLERIVSPLLIARELISIHLHHRELVALTVDLFQFLDGSEHTVVTALLAIELDENTQHVVAVTVVGKELLISLCGLGVVANADIALCHTLW